MWISPGTDNGVFEMDELFWYIRERPHTETRSNTYIITMISREPRQIVGFDVDSTKTASQMQGIVDSGSPAKAYCTDGNKTYLDVIFPGKHIRNIDDKSDTHNVESVNADLRHYLSGLARRSRCFYRSYDTLKAVLAVFIDAYNKFGQAKLKYRVPVKHKPIIPKSRLHHYRDTPPSLPSTSFKRYLSTPMSRDADTLIAVILFIQFLFYWLWFDSVFKN